MKWSIRRALCLLLATVLLLPMATPLTLAAEGGDTIYLRTPEDLVLFSRNCTLDSWSQGKMVYLEADIDLTGADFAPIPIFGGTFEGQGHTISGLSITGSGNIRGLFRHVQPGAAIRDLTVEGKIAPSGREDTLGGLAGSNQGTIVNCHFIGNISGTDSIGGLVGINEAQGQIINCSFFGSLMGEHSAGGIAGQNFGSVVQCENGGNINTDEVEVEMDWGDLDLGKLNDAENLPACTDIGGIAGYSSGVLQGCVNTGAVGYAHIGYNIGGIVGRQSGYLNSCTNSGTILGRKDVGGIAGQLEPEVRLFYNEGNLGRLLDELEVLGDLMEQTGDNLSGSSDELSDRMDNISHRAENARDAIDELGDSVSDWADYNLDELEDLSSRISWLSDELTDILGDAFDIMELAKEPADQMKDILEEALGEASIGSSGQTAVEELLTAIQRGRESMAHLEAALGHLRDALGKPEQTEEALDEIQTAVASLSNNLTNITRSIAEIQDLLLAADESLQGTEEWETLSERMDDFQTASEALPGCLGQVTDALAAVIQTGAEDMSALDQLETATANLFAAGQALAAGEDLASALQSLGRSMESGEDALRHLQELLDQTGSAIGDLWGDSIREISSGVSSLSDDLYGIFREFSDLPTISIRRIDSDIKDQWDDLGDIFSDLLDDGEALRETMSNTTDILQEDLDAVNNQFSVITDLLREILEGSDEEWEDRFEDVSDEETDISDTGFLSDARNDGPVEGDINVGGIVGSMAIEYDFDPENDLIKEGDRSLDFHYRTRAVVLSSINTGEITGKQDYAGGIAGLMDLGRVSGCENYGAVTSTDGDYVGGIAGGAWGSLRDCWVKCPLSGEDYVGGVAGFGTTLVNCHTLVAIDEGSAYLGAVAGDVDRDEGTVSGNTFTSESLGALDGISYAGMAEPVDFDTLCTTFGVPELFSQLELTFVADGNTVAVISFQYGGGIDALPEIPARKGYTASWPDLDYTHLTASQTLEAVYTPYASAITDGGELPEILVDGSFSNRAEVSHTTEDVTWTDDRGQSHTATAYTVTVDDPDLEQVSYMVHYRLPDSSKRYALWVQDENGWSQVDFKIDGQYLLLTSQTVEITFCVTERPNSCFAWIAAGTGCLLILAAALYVLRRVRKNGQ